MNLHRFISEAYMFMDAVHFLPYQLKGDAIKLGSDTLMETWGLTEGLTTPPKSERFIREVIKESP